MAQDQSSVKQDTAVQALNKKIGDLDAHQHQREAVRDQRSSYQATILHEPMARLLTTQQRLELKLDVIEATCVARTTESEVRTIAQSSDRPECLPASTSSMNATRISLSVSRWSCENSCICACHRRQSRRTPRPLDRFLGVLFIGYIGIPYVTTSCDNRECTQRSSPTVSMIYIFPWWLLARAFLLIARLSSRSGLELNLRLPRVVSDTSRIWPICRNGDIEGLMSLIQQGLGSPFDIDSANSTPLLVRKRRICAALSLT